SSLKFSLYAVESDDLGLLLHGQIEGLFTSPRFIAKDGAGNTVAEKSWPGTRLGHEGGIQHLFEYLRAEFSQHHLAGVGHRVVHGGTQLTRPVRVDAGVMRSLETLVPLMPLHQPHNLAPIRILMERQPQLAQVACFDTAFHCTNPYVSTLFGLPLEYAE